MDKVLELKMQLNNYILDMLKEDNFKQNFTELIASEFKNTVASKRNQVLSGETYKIFRNSIKINAYKTFKSNCFREGLYSFIDTNLKNLENSETKLEDIIPPAVVNGLKVYIYNHKDDIVGSLKGFANSENVDKKIFDEISNVLSGINPMVGRFVNLNNIHSRFKTGIDDYLGNQKNILDIINMINSQLDGLMKKRVSEIISQFPQEGINSLKSAVIEGIIKNIASEKFIDMIISKLEDALTEALDSIDEDSENKLNSIDTILKDFIGALYTKALSSDKTKLLIEQLSSNIVENLLNKPLIAFIEN
jgi:hypothetical protein